jgi:hypothetical protein
MGEQKTKLTRYLIFESEDSGVMWKRVGDQEARSSDDALRKFFKEPLTDREGTFVAVSENAFKPRKVEARVRTSISSADLTTNARPLDDTLPV